MRYVLPMLFVVFLMGCSSVQVNYDYDKAVNFSTYRSYNYMPDMQSGLSQLDENRLLRILDSTLQVRGYRLAEEPEFLINIMSHEYQTAPKSSVGLGIGGGGRHVGGGISVGVPVGSANTQRSIQFDLVDAERNALVWQAVAESGYQNNASPNLRERNLSAIVKKVFSKFPPKTD
ncbi:DUF4136 domain-containing protein [Allomuricauda sp. NBRC 101325]|uniref:DUF4136 domain-containing protein n=1 Tax=Allomuricauda sp. NBRC 101325 TaxID=1113758 RepID=UPI0024A2FFE8|nr:DUF4136 domain-containing protein [Muricauda sp. NBRC 101325]GLU43816.1 hypothetical protein Musp01_14400 [Muricauda sp. NBRC 101325]